MFIVKIKREVYERKDGGLPTLFDTSETYIEADEVTVNGEVEPERQAKVMIDFGDHIDDYATYCFGPDDNGVSQATSDPATLIHVQRGDKEHWYLASHAWLMVGGDTVERIAP